jgi:four helix bundle protein
MTENKGKIGYRKLIAWQKADELAFQIYRITQDFPSDEKFGLVSQMRRAALSVAANIAEGYTRNSKKEKVYFYNIAIGSLTEVEYYLDFSLRLNYMSHEKYHSLIKLRSEVGRLLNGLTTTTRNRWQVVRNILLFLLVACFLILAPKGAQAASLYFSPSSGSYNVGSTFTVNVYVSSEDQAMNAASGIISFPLDKLEVISLSKNNSIFSLWVQEPSFSNNLGTINFEGIVLNPGFTGSNGKILAITFKVKSAGVANLNFSSGSVLANDGKGTNILKTLSNATFILNILEQVSAPPVSISGAPEAPQIYSPTHPDSNKWYALKDAKFRWDLKEDINAARVLIGKNPDASPTVPYTPPISEKEVANLDDGVWYFSVQLKNKNGWGAIGRYKIQIDTESPSPFEIQFVDGKETENPKPRIILDANDKLSGIDYYKIKIDDEDFFIVPASQTGKDKPYTLPIQKLGKRTILVQAFDRAGNYTTAVSEFVILPLKAPVITEYPKQLLSGEILIVKGETEYPNAQTILWIEPQGETAKSYTIKNDNNGNFVFASEERLKDGIYKIWAEVVDERGAKSESSNKVTISVEKSAFIRIGSWAISFISIIVSLISLIFILIFVIWYGLYKLALLKKKAKKETIDIEEVLHKAFKFLRKEVQEEIRKLDGRPDLSNREKQIVDNLKNALKITEDYIEEEIKKIEKEIEK